MGYNSKSTVALSGVGETWLALWVSSEAHLDLYHAIGDDHAMEQWGQQGPDGCPSSTKCSLEPAGSVHEKGAMCHLLTAVQNREHTYTPCMQSTGSDLTSLTAHMLTSPSRSPKGLVLCVRALCLLVILFWEILDT